MASMDGALSPESRKALEQIRDAAVKFVAEGEPIEKLLDTIVSSYSSRAEINTASAEILTLYQRQREELERLRLIQFSPSGDNHHNAALCPYCNPKQLAERDRHIAEIRKLREERLTPEESLCVEWEISRGTHPYLTDHAYRRVVAKLRSSQENG